MYITYIPNSRYRFTYSHHGLPVQLFNSSLYKAPCTCSVQQAHSFHDLIELAFPMLRYLGCHLSCDAALITKVIRVVRAFITMVRPVTEPPCGSSCIQYKYQRVYCRIPGYIQRANGTYSKSDSDQLLRHCLSVLDEVILPSLCLAEANCCLAEQVWSVLQHLPYELRYVCPAVVRITCMTCQPWINSPALNA